MEPLSANGSVEYGNDDSKQGCSSDALGLWWSAFFSLEASKDVDDGIEKKKKSFVPWNAS